MFSKFNFMMQRDLDKILRLIRLSIDYQEFED
jgi:hypothetical protein